MGEPVAVTAEWRRPLSEYLAWLDTGGIPEGTRALRSYHLRRFAAETGAGPWDATPDLVADHLRNPAWSKNTRRSVRSTLRSFYKWALLKHHADTDPTAELPTIPSTIGKPRPAPEKVVEIGLSTTDQRTRLMVSLAAWCGLRCCEIAVIHSSDVTRRFDGWELRVHGKGDKLRVVPVPDLLGRRIERADGYLFPGDKNGHLSAHYVSKLVSRALPDGWTAHTLRHRFASAAYLADRDIRAVQELLGHASVATTQIYTAVPMDGIRRAAMNAYTGPHRLAS